MTLLIITPLQGAYQRALLFEKTLSSKKELNYMIFNTWNK